ncbi:hypothetical protein B7R21_16595 [Subtercola boreus]|uniref:Uncharacterized protein n=1 Tax=Subtercola boreus TaxID=120213 RepID=A0A3E0VBR9_9MICO|nr:hypothetical protein [Subtercola boreus]RFA07139.1 hypothetical protein B7R21_16595 [Subtercola boreus]
MRNAFIALGGIAAAVAVITLVLSNTLGIGGWQSGGISAPNTSTPAPPHHFVLPDDCASLVDPSIIAEWSARYGDAPLISELGSPIGGPRVAGGDCSYGAAETAFASLSVSVTVFSADNPRAASEQGLQDQGMQSAVQPDGSTLYYSDTPGIDFATAEMVLVADEAVISVRVNGVSAADGPGLMPLLSGWLAKVSDRVGLTAPTTPTFSSPQPTNSAQAATTFQLPASCAGAVGTSILPAWSPRFGEATTIDDSRYRALDGGDSVGVHCAYGSNQTGRLLTVIVGTIDTASDGRQRAEAQARLISNAEQPLGNGTLFAEPLGGVGGEPVSASLTLITDKAIITVAARGTEQRSAELLPYLREWLDDIATRTGANS